MTSYNKLTFASLQELLIARGLTATGTKAQLVARLKQQDREAEATEKAMADAIKAASVAPPQGDQDKYGDKSTDYHAEKKAKKVKKGKMKGGTEGGKHMKRKEKDKLSASMRRMRLMRKLDVRMASKEDEVKRLMMRNEVSETDEKIGDIVINSTRKRHAKGLATGRYADMKQERNEYASEARSTGYEKAVTRRYFVLQLLLVAVIPTVAGALMLCSGKAGELLSWIVGL